ncbi:helicase-associated domain-containing protein [Granulicoccus sp. GXG6511]|uniref:helicase-associated domain-containing protein n=1 Tax=Granulicoccus sp. GXG6511 TaxID=3381351 RepID=UPI003D7ED1EA
MPGLIDALRELTAAELTRLLTDRPDLAVPAPADLAQVADRAIAPASLRRALDLLDRRQLAVAEAIAALARPSPASVADLVGFDPGPVLARLAELGLVWGALEHCLHQVFEPFPGGLAPESPEPLSAQEIHLALVDLPAAAHDVLHKLTPGPPTGAVRHADRTISQPTTPIEHLLARGLLRAADANTVVIPREVALHLRGGVLRETPGEPAGPRPGPRALRIIDSAAVGAAVEFVQTIEGLLDGLSRRTPIPLRTGGLPARDLTVLAHAVDADPDKAAFALEVAHSARLLVATGPAIVPTDAFERWLGLGLAERYAEILRTWFRSRRWFATGRAEGGRPLASATTPAVNELPWAPDLRRALLTPLAPGHAIDVDALTDWAAWHRPALERAGDLGALTAAVLAEADWLGLTAFDQASTLVTGVTAELPTETTALFPEFTDHLILQSDLTAVATGPLDRSTAAVLALLADTESRGGGGVFRFTASSVRRGFDAGWAADDIEAWLAGHSHTEVPQPLRYLISDIARLHGTVRVGAARAYVRIDDPVRLNTVLEHPLAAEFGLRQVGPETLVAAADPAEVVDLLRQVGLTPAAENAAGEMLASPPPRRPPAPTQSRRTPPDPAAVAATLIAQRNNRQIAARTEAALDLLDRAARESLRVEVEFVAADGTPAVEVAVPLSLAAGVVRLAGGTQQSLPLARITAVRLGSNRAEA